MLRKWRVEIALLLLAFAILFGFYLYNNSANSKDVAAIVFINGTEIMQIDLVAAKDEIVYISDNVQLEIKDNSIAFVNVTCPDHICEQAGFLHKDGQTAVCMPNKTVVTIKSS